MDALKEWIFVDTETTGLDPIKNCIVQLAAVAVNHDLEPRGYFMMYCDPDKQEIAPKAMEVNKLNETFLRQQVNEFQMMDAFINWIPNGAAVIAGYKIDFDIKFIRAAEERTKIKIPFVTPALDVYELAKKQLMLPDYKLDTVRQHFGLSTVGSHDAMKDIMDTLTIARKLRKNVREMPVLRYVPQVEQLALQPAASH